MDWGIGQGYAGLMNTSNRRESAKEELGMLQVLDQQMKSDRAEKEQADLKEQAYQAEVSKFADTLLAPDRTRINQKSKVLSSMIREHVKANGGDMTKFFANGGHKVLGEYKNALINSEESSQYIDNKKNMERIVDMQMKGFGHLINQNDTFNLENYQKNGQGKITYTGQLNEIKVPDLSTFDMGQEVKPEQILHHDQNYVKFLGNYKMTYPSAPYPPTDQQLKDFVALSHSDLIGTNWQKDLGYKKEAYDQEKDQRNFEADQEQRGIQNSQWYITHQASREDAEVTQRIALRQLELQEAQARGQNMTDDEADQSAKAQSDWISDVSETISSVGYDMKTISDINANSFNKYATTFGLPSLQDFNTGAEDYSDSGGGGILRTGDGNSMKDILAPGFAVRGSKLIINGQNATSAVKASELFTLDDKNIINGIDLTQHTDMFDAAGRSIAHWSTPVSKKGLITKNYAEDVADRKFKVKGVVTGAYGKDATGKEIIVMNRVKGKGSKVVDPKGTKEYEKTIGKEVTGAGMFIVIESEQGDRFLKPLRDSSQLALFAKWGGASTRDAKKAMQEGHNRAEKVQFKEKQSKQNILGAVDQVNRDPELTNRIIQDARMIPGAGTAGSKYTPLIMSFYAQQKNAYAAQGVDAGMDEIQQMGKFNQIMQYVNSNPDYKKQFQSLLNTPQSDERKIIDYLVKIDAVNSDYAEEWKNSLQFIKNRK